MQINEKIINSIRPHGFLRRNECIIDIATSSFRRRGSSLNAVSVVYCDGDVREVTLIPESVSGEIEAMKKLREILSGFDTAITFNGNAFDMPVLKRLLQDIGSEDFLERLTLRDLFLEYRSLSPVLGLPGRKLADYASLFASHDGGEISREYLASVGDAVKTYIIMPLDALKELLSGCFSLISASRGTKDQGRDELVFDMRMNTPFPGTIRLHDEVYRITADENEAILTVPVEDERVRLYHPDIENYFYLPMEGSAVHRSVAGFVDKSRKEKAVRSNCFNFISYSERFISDKAYIEKFISSVLAFMNTR